MPRRWWIMLAVLALIGSATLQATTTATPPAAPTAAPPAEGQPKKPDLQFTELDQDLLVKMWIDGPATRQVVLTHFNIDDGKAAWDEPPIGVEKPRRQPRVILRYLVLINAELPGFAESGPLTPPTPPEERRKQRQEVAWRLPNIRQWDFHRNDAAFHVEGSTFTVAPEQLRQALPTLRKWVEGADQK